MSVVATCTSWRPTTSLGGQRIDFPTTWTEQDTIVTAGIEGIWRLDFYGGHGWETVGTLTLSDGKVSGGSITHFTAGSYSLEGASVRLDTAVNFYGNHKPFFGSRAQRVRVHMNGKLDGDTIEGQETSPDGPSYSYRFKLVRQADLG
jgi:hypothetical protein